jgi:hypothetical protein
VGWPDGAGGAGWPGGAGGAGGRGGAGGVGCAGGWYIGGPEGYLGAEGVMPGPPATG